MIKREGWSEFLYLRERVIGVKRWMKTEKGRGGGEERDYKELELN
jgi:hypothetical protein